MLYNDFEPIAKTAIRLGTFVDHIATGREYIMKQKINRVRSLLLFASPSGPPNEYDQSFSKNRRIFGVVKITCRFFNHVCSYVLTRCNRPHLKKY